MKKKILILIFLTIITVNIKAKINNNYNISANYSNKYIINFKDYEKYIVKSSNNYIIPFKYENNVLSTFIPYENGGMISLYEFKTTFFKKDSYLLSGQEYWTLTNKNTNINYIISHNNEKYKNIIDASGLRVTEQILEKTRVGTYILTVIATDEYSNSSVTAIFTVNIKNTTTTRYITTERDYDYTTRRTTPTRTPRPTSPTRTPRPTTPSTRPTTRKTTSNDCTCTGGPDCYNGVICKPGKKPWIMDCCQ